jgi:hypothetical protein
MADDKLYVHVLLDRSGSMESCREQTIAAFNSYVKNLAAQSAATRLSLTIFDSESIDLIIDTVRIRDVKRLTNDDFEPRGSTPLLDAVGKTVLAIDRVTLLPDERVALAILTDGLENASQEFKRETIHDLLTTRQEKQNWLVQYLGANQDAWEVGAQLGVPQSASMSYRPEDVEAAMQSVSSSMGRYRRAPAPAARFAASFTPAERSASGEDKTRRK